MREGQRIHITLNAGDSPIMNAGLVVFFCFFFQGIRTSIAKKKLFS